MLLRYNSHLHGYIFAQSYELNHMKEHLCISSHSIQMVPLERGLASRLDDLLGNQLVNLWDSLLERGLVGRLGDLLARGWEILLDCLLVRELGHHLEKRLARLWE